MCVFRTLASDSESARSMPRQQLPRQSGDSG